MTDPDPHQQTDAKRATLEKAMTALHEVGVTDPGFDMAVVDDGEKTTRWPTWSRRSADSTPSR